MALKDKREDRMQLIEQIEEWNANRLDLFELSLPDEVNTYNLNHLVLIVSYSTITSLIRKSMLILCMF